MLCKYPAPAVLATALLSLILVTSGLGAAKAATPPEVTPSTNPAGPGATGPLPVEEVAPFFSDFQKKGMKPTRGEFETKEEYEKRLPKPWDSEKVVFFSLNRSKLNKAYRYDVDRELLTVQGGKVPISASDLKKEFAGTPVTIFDEWEDKGEYEAKNGFGERVTVKKTWLTEYVLFLDNIGPLPETVYDRNKRQFEIQLSRAPKAAAELSKNVELLLAVRLKGYE